MAARAGAGIDLGEDDILVDLNLGMRCTGLGAVVGTGRCGGRRGGGQRYLCRWRGARGSGRSIQDETKKRREDNSDNRQSTTIPANFTDVTENLVTHCHFHFQSFMSTSTFQPVRRVHFSLPSTPSNVSLISPIRYQYPRLKRLPT
jgi:hypothetical protein